MVEIIEADFASPGHAEAIVNLLNEYACDEMGGGKALPEHVRQNLVAELKKRSTAHAILAHVNGDAAGLVICFEGFSTFACRPLLNIHDMIVASRHRGQGLSKALLLKAEEIAVRLGCSKLTLEVLEGNKTAQGVYRSLGFSGYELDPKMGKALFWEKRLSGK